MLAQSEDAFNDGDYTRASEFAEEATVLVLDIAQDGTPNDADFAPDINNNRIYGGAAIFLICLTLISITGLKIRGRRIRAKEAEKQRREKAKQKIIDIINEVI